MKAQGTILHIITSIEPGGAEHHLLYLAQRQVKQGYGVVVAYLKPTSRHLGEEFNRARVKTVSLGLKSYGQIAPIMTLYRLIEQLQPDIVHAHLPPAELYARLALLCDPKRAFVISKHNDERFAPVPLATNLARWVAKRAASVICISHAVEEFWKKKKVIKTESSYVVHYGVAQIAQPDKKTLRNSLDIGKKEVLFGFVGRLVPQKSLGDLLKAFALLANPHARLAIVGDGPLKRELQVMAKKLHISESVIFTGYRNDIPTVMSGLDVFVLSSIYEGFGLVLLEAMRAAKPVLATRVSAIPEVVSDEVTGILVPACNPEIMAEAMKRFMDEENRVRMGQAGKVRVAKEFGVERMSQRTRQVYERTLNPCVE